MYMIQGDKPNEWFQANPLQKQALHMYLYSKVKYKALQKVPYAFAGMGVAK